MTRRLAATTATFAALLALSACGTDESDSTSGPGAPTDPAATDNSEAAPACELIWQEGETLPEDYEGCEDEGGAYLAAEWQPCGDPALEFTVSEEGLAAKRGGTITADRAEIKALREACQA